MEHILNLVMWFYTLVFYLSGIYCFNVDIDNVVSIRDTNGSYFGYSALMFINKGQKWVVVGAPKANFTTPNPYKSPGNVYKCRLNFTSPQQEECTAMNLEQTDDFRFPDSPGYEEDYEMLGATMAMIDDTIIICAPLWKYYIPWKNQHTVYPYGRCFNVNRTLGSYSSIPFKTAPLRQSTNWTVGTSEFFYEFAQIGFSISSRKYHHPSHHVLLGAPGFIENEGGFVQYNEMSMNAETDFIYSFTRPAFQNQEPLQHGDLMGYSVTTGIITTGGKCQNVVVFGAPHFRSADGIVGSVFVVCAEKTTSEQIIIQKQFYGQKSGGGFGTSVVFQDVNNDGLDDLFVGEPLYFDNTANEIDVGAVHIYYGFDDISVILNKSSQVLIGSGKENGRFGTSMECVGDLNKDNYNDIVVSAPYEDDFKGAIYIYHGGEKQLTLTQRITAEDVGIKLHSFGWYISPAYDIDNNGYPDFLIGSYMSDTVSIFRTRPIAIMNVTLDVIPRVIPYNSTGLGCKDELNRPCVSLQFCFSYSGQFVPETIYITYTIDVDIQLTRVENKTSRMNLIGDQTHSYFAKKEIRTCLRTNAFVETLGKEFFESLEEEIVFEIHFEPQYFQRELLPFFENSSQQAKATFSKEFEHVLLPDLKIKTHLLGDEVILRESTEIGVFVNVSNTGEDTYGTKITITFSNNMQYIGLNQPQLENTKLVLCNNITTSSDDLNVQCNFKDTFHKNQTAIIILRFAINRSLLSTKNHTLKDFRQDIFISSFVQSIRPDSDITDNMDTVSARVKLKSSVEIGGSTTNVFSRNNDRYITTTFTTVTDVHDKTTPFTTVDVVHDENNVNSSTIYLPRKFNWWVIIGSPLISIVLLALTTFGLWKRGFFERKKKDAILRWRRKQRNYHELQDEEITFSEHLVTQNNDVVQLEGTSRVRPLSDEHVYMTPDEPTENDNTGNTHRYSYEDALTPKNTLLGQEKQQHVQSDTNDHVNTITNESTNRIYEKQLSRDPNEHVYSTTNESTYHEYEQQEQRDPNEHVYTKTHNANLQEYEKYLPHDPNEHLYNTVHETTEHEYENKNHEIGMNMHVNTTTKESTDHE